MVLRYARLALMLVTLIASYRGCHLWRQAQNVLHLEPDYHFKLPLGGSAMRVKRSASAGS